MIKKSFINKIRKNNHFWWSYLVGGILCLILAFLFFPSWTNVNASWIFWKDWSKMLVNFVVGLFLLAYLSMYLFKKMIHEINAPIKVLTIIEFVLLSLVDIYLLISSFIPFIPDILKEYGACRITGVVIYIRAVVEIFRAYFYQKRSIEKYPLYWVIVSIVLITLGLIMIIKPFFEDLVIMWIFDILLILSGILLIIYAIYIKPRMVKRRY